MNKKIMAGRGRNRIQENTHWTMEHKMKDANRKRVSIYRTQISKKWKLYEQNKSADYLHDTIY